jgi:hypothetical protein
MLSSDGIMAPWDFHEFYPFIDVDSILIYPNHRLSKWIDGCLEHDGDMSMVFTYVAKLIRYTKILKSVHEYVRIQIFLGNMSIEIRMSLVKCLKPKSVSSLTCLIIKFLGYGSKLSNT